MQEKEETAPSGIDFSRIIPLAFVIGPHGVKGEIKLRNLASSPEKITAYGPLFTRAGALVSLAMKSVSPKHCIAAIEGVVTREAALAWRGVELCVPRAALPALPEGEFYHEDLIGCSVFTLEGARFGLVASLHDFGGGDIIAIRREDEEELLYPFKASVFPVIDPEGRRLVIDPPEMIDLPDAIKLHEATDEE
jgi:16S rRNA processing protein RimM